jgi:hypothetical protein
MESPLSFDSTENFRKKLLLKNLKPYKVDGFYASNDGSVNTEIVLIDYSVIDEQTVDVTAKQIEPRLIGLNKYTPIGGTFGDLVSINLNYNSQTNFGNYSYIQSEGSKLESFGRQKEIESIVQNQYGPEGQQSKTTVTPNLNFQNKANEGNYGYPDSVGSEIELEGDKQEKLSRVLNKYSPSNIQNGYGDSVLFPLLVIGSNQGDYLYVSNGPNLTTSQSQDSAYVTNLYGPNGGFDSPVNIGLTYQTQSNKGEYSFGVSSPNRTTEQSQKVSYIANIFGPENQPNGFGDMVNPNLDYQTQSNQGEFNYETSSPSKTTEQSQSFLYAKNRYNNGDGTYEVLSVEDLAFENINEPYYSSKTTFVFLPSDYTPFSILSNNDINGIVGSEGSLSQDSDLAKLGAKQLQKEFKARLAFELLQQTLGRTILTNSSIEPNSGGISVKPNLDPFDALGVVMNKIPLLQKDFRITSIGGGILGDTLSFTSRLSGVYSPYSLIPGSYFDYPSKNLLSQVTSNPIGTVAGIVTNLATKILSANIDTGSERLLANTSSATRSLLFDLLWYNQYRPKYKLDSGFSPNLSAPGGNFYVGKTKNYLRDLVSPVTDLPKDKNGNPSIGPVYDYGRVGRDFEGTAVNQKLFGLNARPFYDKSGGIQGGFTWSAKKDYLDPGSFVGPKNEKSDRTNDIFGSGFEATFKDTKSSEIELTPGSILDVTQKLVEAGSSSSANKLEHVGNAINQISKVFNDGYIETTKGSRVRRYLTPTAADQAKGSEVKTVVGYEYARLFTKDRPYYSFNELQKKDGNIRKYNSSVLDNTFNLNIAPMQGKDSTNIQLNSQGKMGAKKYMFSIENLAWRTSSRVGYRVEDLPASEIGPNGGRVMWFPPYDLSFDDSTQTNWQDNVFLGRTEPVYTFTNSKRSGTISFKIIVDHPSVMNVLVKKELEKSDESEATKVIDSLFAGCLKYDLVDLLRKFPMFSYSDIYKVIESLNDINQIKNVVANTPNTVGPPPAGTYLVNDGMMNGSITPDNVINGIQSNITAANNDNPNNTPTEGKRDVVETGNLLRTDLTKRLLRKLLNEANYFEMIKESNPMIYDGIKSKFKNFHPMFHSITPEGLNSRLTFLNQCMRPGDTIPTATDNGGKTKFEYNDVFNSAFGTPPVCVLRVGDFYHSKIVIERLTLKYEDAKFDINPEGIGLQPMIASVDLSFNFIGGHGINNPVSELQNALSFNYYANTEMYDDRATITEDVFTKFDSELLKDIKDLTGLITTQPTGSGIGSPIGTIKKTDLDLQTSAITGTIEYKAKMVEFVKSTGGYFNALFTNLKILKDYLYLGGLLLYTKQRNYKQGYFDYLSGTTNSLMTTILGKPENYQDTLDKLIARGKDDVDELLTPVLAQVGEKDFPNAQIRKVKRQLKSMIDEMKPAYLTFLEDTQTSIIAEELKFITLSDQLNFVINKKDGYETDKKVIIIYDLSGKTEGVDGTTDGTITNTYDELKTDFFKIGEDLNKFMFNLDKYGIVPTGETTTYKDDFKTQLYLNEDLEEDISPSKNVFFMLFGAMIIENPGTFVDNLVSDIGETETNITEWKTFIYNNLGYNYENGTSTKKSKGLVADFIRSKNKIDSDFEKFKNDYFDKTLPDSLYKPFTKDKERLLDYKKQEPTNTVDETNLRNVWQSVDGDGDKYNLKKKMN